MQGKIVLVTGANSGIGKATALGLAQMGAHVLLHARDPHKGAAAVAEIQNQRGHAQVELLLADLAEQRQIHQLAETVKNKYPCLDVLINNAAIIPGKHTLSPDGIEQQLAVNHLAYFLLTNLLLEPLKATGGRIVNVSSMVHYGAKLDFDDLEAAKSYGAYGWGQYASTKLMNVIFTAELARRLVGSGVIANSLHPGVINTQLTRETPLARFVRPFFGSPLAGAETSLYLASSPKVAQISGRYFDDERLTAHDSRADDPALGKQLWEISAQMVNLT